MVRVTLMLVVAIGLSACARKPDSKFLTYDGPEVTSIQVHKASRKMYLLHEGQVLKQYDVSLGFAPDGHKQFEGDGRTPEGTYFTTYHNPRSRYHLSIGISYPNERDRTTASTMGKMPGGDIMIHGRTDYQGNKGDWTAGCIAVRDHEMEEIYAMVRGNTPIHVLP